MAKEKITKPPEGVVTSPAPVPSSEGYETLDGNEALRYTQAGGHLVSVTARYPSKDPNVPSFRPGKRYRFLESKSSLDELLKQQEVA